MMQSKRSLAIPFAMVLASCVTTGITPLTTEELSTLDYGACPHNYAATINDQFQSGLLTAYSGAPIIWPPHKNWYRETGSGRLLAGYLIPVTVEQTRGSPGLSGTQLYGFLFHNDELVAKLNPIQMYSLNTQDEVGPIPKDERDWKVGFSERFGQHVHYALPGETPQNWSELIILEALRNVPNMRPEKFVELYQKKKPGCVDVSKRILASTPTEVLYEETFTKCAPMRDEYAIRKMIRTPRTMTEVSYFKTSAMGDAERAKWIEIVGRTRLLDRCQR